MRISDWSSDVCSSDLRINHVAAALPGRHVFKYVVTHIQCADSGGPVQLVPRKRIKITIDGLHVDGLVGYCLGAVDQHLGTGIMRSEESRVGKGGGSPCRSRVAKYP